MERREKRSVCQTERERSGMSEKVKKKKKKKSWRTEKEVGLTWCVALSLDLGAEGDRAGRTEPAAQSLLLCSSLRSLFTHEHPFNPPRLPSFRK